MGLVISELIWSCPSSIAITTLAMRKFGGAAPCESTLTQATVTLDGVATSARSADRYITGVFVVKVTMLSAASFMVDSTTFSNPAACAKGATAIRGRASKAAANQ